jgi:glycosyltransferase involved in cell wall biosynthesis
MSAPVFLNTRFRVQAMTGVQRFASEIAAALPLVWPSGRPAPAELAPRPGGPAGQLWEQVILPLAASGGVLANLGNTGPIFGGRRLVVIHDAGVFATPEAYGWKFRLWYRLLHRALFAGRARIATVSAFSRAELVRVFGADPAGIAVLGEGGEHILRLPPDPTVLARHGLTAGRYVLAVGSLAAHKNLAALSVLADQLAARGMTLAITGGLAAGVFTRDGARLPDHARYVGRVDDAELRALYENAACFVFPSRYEGFGLPAVEAMACACPVVAARAGALPEVCGNAAAYCDPHDPANIAATVLGVIDTPGRADDLRAAGRLRVAGFTWASAATRLRDALLDLEAAR